MKLPEYLEKFMKLVPESFVNYRCEFIIYRKENIFFQLHNVENELDFKFKILAWLSRPIHKELSKRKASELLRAINEYLETNFLIEDFDLIYTKLGNACNKDLAINFIENNYNLELLKSE